MAVARATDQTVWLNASLSLSAQLYAARGDATQCRRDAAEAQALGLGGFVDYAACALGHLALATGQPRDAIVELEGLIDLDLGQGQNLPLMGAFDLIEALTLAGRRDDALHALGRIERGYAGRPWELAGMARCRGLLADDANFVVPLQRSSEQFGELTLPFEQARSKLCLGNRLRQAGDRPAARVQLRAALATFDELGAEPWIEQATRGLRASGQRMGRRLRGAVDELTPQELQVALQAAQDKTNKEIASTLLMSPRTVELQLSRVCAKLGLASRTALMRHFAPETTVAAATEATSGRVLTTVLFTDLVGSTEHAARLGDRRWRVALERYYELSRREIDGGGGEFVNSTGDGLLATFDSPERALRCAVELRRIARGLSFESRSGIHAGECERSPGDIKGIAVHIGARAMSQAASGEILATQTVRDLVAGADVAFESRGEYTLKGVPGTWTLFALLDNPTKRPPGHELKTQSEPLTRSPASQAE
jgi:class 3 adenylate cyclase